MIDDFVTRNLPPCDEWPEFRFDLPALHYPARLNAAVELLDRAVAEGDGDRLAVVNADGCWTYAALKHLSDRIARLLVEEEGLVPGNRVLLRGANSMTLFAAWFAVLKAGGVVVATMPLLRAGEIATLLTKAEISHAIVDAVCEDELDTAAGMAGTLRSRLVYDGDSGTGALERRAAAVAPGFAALDTGRDDPAIIAFTSGTTGVPKGTVHFHRDLLAPADSFAGEVLRPRPGAIWSGTPPIAFTFGLGGLVLFPFRFRGTSVTLKEGGPAALLDAIARYGIELLFTAPTAYRAMLDVIDGGTAHDLASLTTCVSAGEHLPEPVWHRWREATGLALVNGIGATEMMHIFISASGDAIRPGATGRAVPGYRACVLDADDRPLAEGIGRLAVKGPTGCRYLADQRQSTYVVDGWNVTGDSYRLDADGYFWYLARADDMIVSSGYNIAPPEVEAALLAHAAVAECGVVGAPDAARGTLVKAFVVAASGHEPGPVLARALQDHVKAMIAPYKYPRAIEFVTALPRTATGKLQRHKLREGHA